VFFFHVAIVMVISGVIEESLMIKTLPC